MRRKVPEANLKDINKVFQKMSFKVPPAEAQPKKMAFAS